MCGGRDVATCGETTAARGRAPRLVLAALFGAAVSLGLGTGCASTRPRHDPTGELLPRVTGTALTGEERVLPDCFRGEPVLLLVGYLQHSQFDIDRWLLGLMTVEAQVRVAEIPTIPGMAPSLFSGMIDDGMRRGIPRDDWAGVITLYGDDAARVATATGDENPLPARVLLLDATGRIAWFRDQGFSPRGLKELTDKVRDLSFASSEQRF